MLVLRFCAAHDGGVSISVEDEPWRTTANAVNRDEVDALVEGREDGARVCVVVSSLRAGGGGRDRG